MAKKKGRNPAASCSVCCKQKAHQHNEDRPKSKIRKLLLTATTTLFWILPHVKNGSDAILSVRELYKVIFG